MSIERLPEFDRDYSNEETQEAMPAVNFETRPLPVIEGDDSNLVETKPSMPAVEIGYEQRFMYAHIDQIRAADYARSVIDDLGNRGLLEDEGLKGVRETDVYRLRRGLCLPSAASASINWVKGERVIGDADGDIRVGDIFDIMVPYHGSKELDPRYERGWLFSTEEGDIYHQAIVAFSEGMDVPAMPVKGFKSVRDFEPFVQEGRAVAVSFDNGFVLDKTLQNKPELVNGERQVLIEGNSGVVYRSFEIGRHVVAILEIEDEHAVILDSFRLPQLEMEDVILRLPIYEVDDYLQNGDIGNSRAIMFSKNRSDFNDWRHLESPVSVPPQVVNAVRNRYSAGV